MIPSGTDAAAPLLNVATEKKVACSADVHAPIHKNFSRIILKYKWYILVQLVSIIVSVSCCFAMPNHSNSTLTVGLTWESYFAINCVVAAILLLLIGFPPDLVLVLISVVLSLTPCNRTECVDAFVDFGKHCKDGVWGNCTIISMQQAWMGFKSTSILSIAVLFMVAKGVEKTGIVAYLAQFVLGSPKFLWLAILRMCLPVSIVSAFINDTPVVAVMMPIIEGWALKTGTSVSKLMIPLSYSALLGGMCTLTGTSTNLVLQGLVNQDNKSNVTVTMFEMTPVGACVAVSCIIYMAIFARCLLPNRKVGNDDGADIESDRPKIAQQYVVDFIVRPKSSLCGKPINQTILDDNDITILSTGTGAQVQEPSDKYVIQGGDLLIMKVSIPKFLKLRHNRDLEFCRQKQITETLGPGRRHRRLYSVFVAPGNSIIGELIRNQHIGYLHQSSEIIATGYDRDRFKSALRQRGANTDITAGHVISEYNALIIESYPSFLNSMKSDAQFLNVAEIPLSTPPRNYKKSDNYRMLISGVILVAMIVGIATDSHFVFEWAIIASFLLIWTQCLTVEQAFKAVKGRVILGIMAAMGAYG